MTNKYSARVVFWDNQRMCVTSKQQADSLRVGKQKRLPSHIFRFDSKLEFEVYLHLLKMYPANRIRRQVPLPLIRKGLCYPRGKPWKIDFAITWNFNKNHIYRYVEAKGIVTSDFRNILPVLEQNNPEAFSKLILVFGSSIPTKNRIISNLLASKKKRDMYTLRTFNLLEKIP